MRLVLGAHRCGVPIPPALVLSRPRAPSPEHWPGA